MKTYARIDAGRVMELFETDGDITKMFHPALVWANVTTVIPTPEVRWTATQDKDVWSFAPPVAAN